MKTFRILAIVAIALMISGTAFAAKGGQPAKHGVDGKTYGEVVSDAAKNKSADFFPGDHASGGKRKGKDFNPEP